MKQIIAAAVLMAILPTAYAQEKAASQLTHTGEYRIRDVWMDNESGGVSTMPNSSNTVDHRFKLGLGFKVSERLSTNLTLLANANWGQAPGENLAQPDATTGTSPEQNFLAVNQMYVDWVISDILNLRLGRMNYQFGDGSVMGLNDWEATPYAYEGVVANYTLGVGRLQGFVFKFRDQALITGAPGKDSERNAYGIVFDLNTTSELLKGFNVHVIKDAANALAGGPTTNPTVKTNQGQDVIRYGASTALTMSIVDFKAWYAGATGKNRDLVGGVRIDQDVSTSMMQAEVGVNFPSFMGSRVFALYHQDSGDSDPTAGSENTYDSYFYNRHENAGLMDLFDWGNLTYIQVGWTGKISDATDVGASYLMFQKTESGGPVVAGLYGGNLTSGTLGTGDKIGNEIDVWAEHRYESGFAMIARAGYFMPGDTLKDATPNGRHDSIAQVMLQGKMTF